MSNDFSRFDLIPDKKKYAIILGPEPCVSNLEESIQVGVESFNQLNYLQIHVISPYEAENARNWKSETGSVEKCLKEIAKDFQMGDLLSIYVTTHGNQAADYREILAIELPPTNTEPELRPLPDSIPDEETFLYFDDGNLYSQDFAKLVDAYLPNSNRLVIADICFGYDFMLPLLVYEGNVGISAAEQGREAYSNHFRRGFFPDLIKEKNVFFAFVEAYDYVQKKKREQKPQFIEMTAEGLSNLTSWLQHQ